MKIVPGDNVQPSQNQLTAPLTEPGAYVLPGAAMLPGLNSPNYGELAYDSLTYGGTE